MKPRSNQSKIWVHKTSLTPPLLWKYLYQTRKFSDHVSGIDFVSFHDFSVGIWNCSHSGYFCIFVFYFIIQELTWDCYFLTWDCYFLPWDWYFLIWDCYFLTWDCYFICLSVLTYKFNNSIKCQTMLNDDCRRDVYSGMCKFVVHHQDIMNCSIF